MKTSILIAGFCLLALTSTITEALDKKQPCVPDASLLSCISQVTSGTTAVCNDDSCRNALLQYYTDCGIPRLVFDALCPGGNNGGDNNGGDNGGDNNGGDNDGGDNGGDNNGGDNDGGDNSGGDNNGGDNGGDSSAATVGVTLFTIVSAALVAVGN